MPTGFAPADFPNGCDAARAVGFSVKFAVCPMRPPGLLNPCGGALSALSTLGWTRARAAANAASIPKSEVSSKAASGACFRGEIGAGAVGMVAGDDFGQQFGLVPRRCPGLAAPASGDGRALPGAASTNSLAVASGADDGADVAAVHHRARAAARADGRGNRAGTRAAPGAPPEWRRPAMAALPTMSVRMAGSPARVRSMAARALDARRPRWTGSPLASSTASAVSR